MKDYRKMVFQYMQEYINKFMSKPFEISESTNLLNEGMDSLDIIELIMDIEDKYIITIPDETIGNKIYNIKDFLDLVVPILEAKEEKIRKLKKRVG